MKVKKGEKHCCSVMDYYANPEYYSEHEVMEYKSYRKDYDLVLHGKDSGMEQVMLYCPWCGSKLPESLGEEWCKVVKDEVGYDDVFAEEWQKLPEEFRTDEWWKKRGL